MIIENTYFVSGTIEREISLEFGGIGRIERHSIYREVEAKNEELALAQLTVGGWEWSETPAVWLVSEAAKMEAAGQPTLFPLDGAL